MAAGLWVPALVGSAHLEQYGQGAAIVAFESLLLAFLGLCGHDMALRIRRLCFYILFHGDGLQVRDLSATCTGKVTLPSPVMIPSRSSIHSY